MDRESQDQPAFVYRLFWNRLFETCLCVQCSFCGQAFSTSFLCLAAGGLQRHETQRPGVRSTWEGGPRPPLLLHHSATLTGQPPPTESVRPGSLQGPQGPGGLRGPRGLCSQPARGVIKPGIMSLEGEQRGDKEKGKVGIIKKVCGAIKLKFFIMICDITVQRFP